VTVKETLQTPAALAAEVEWLRDQVLDLGEAVAQLAAECAAAKRREEALRAGIEIATGVRPPDPDTREGQLVLARQHLRAWVEERAPAAACCGRPALRVLPGGAR
jgi:hypothetical protein